MSLFGYSGEEDEPFDGIASFDRYLERGEAVFLEAAIYEKIILHYADSDEWAKAEKATEWGLQFHPFSFELQLMRVRILASTASFEETMEALESCEHLQPSDPDIKITKGNIYLTYNRFEEAVDCLKSAVNDLPDHPHPLYSLAYAYQCLSKYEECIRYYKAALLVDEAFEDAALDLIHCSITENKSEQCRAFLEKRLDADPYSAHYWMYLGIYHYERSEWKLAARAFEYTTLTDPENGIAYERLGHVLMNLQEFNEAALAYESAIEQLGKTAKLYCHLGASYEQQGDFRRAYHFYRKATQIDQECGDGWFGMATCLMESQKWLEAVRFLEKAIQINRYSDLYWLQMATAEYELGNWRSCEEAFEKSVAMNGKNEQGWLRWSMAHYQHGNLKRALEIISNGLDDMPDSPELNYRASAYYLYSGDYQRGLYYLEVALRLNYEMHSVMYELFPNLSMQKTIARIIREIMGEDED